MQFKPKLGRKETWLKLQINELYWDDTGHAFWTENNERASIDFDMILGQPKQHKIEIAFVQENENIICYIHRHNTWRDTFSYAGELLAIKEIEFIEGEGL